MVEHVKSSGPWVRSWPLWLMAAGAACSAPSGEDQENGGPTAEGSGGTASGTGGIGATGGLAATGGDAATGGLGATGGDAATGGLAQAGGGTGTGGLGATGGTGTGGGAVDDNACGNGVANEAHVPEMVSAVCETSNIPNCNITDFTAGSFDAAEGTWGDDMSLTGGSFDYKDEASTLTWDVSGDQLNLTASLVADGYVGVGLWFGPCTDATDFDGIQITLAGDLGGASLELQVNSDENYPIEERDNFGSCAHADGEEWSDCTNNATILSPVAATNTTFQIPWSNFTGGTPVASLSPNQLGGIQLQIGCAEAAAPCAVNLEVYDIRFYRPGVGAGDAQD